MRKASGGIYINRAQRGNVTWVYSVYDGALAWHRELSRQT
jgi:hypothetical protein